MHKGYIVDSCKTGGILMLILRIVGFIAIIAGGGIFASAKSAVHEIEGLMLFLIASVLISSSFIIDTISKAKENKEQKVEEPHLAQ